MAALGLAIISLVPAVEANELPDYLYSKGGIIYPSTGDSTQTLFHTPPNITNHLKPGMLLAVLPTDCLSASRGSIGSYYRCNHDLALKAEEHNGNTVYRVIEP